MRARVPGYLGHNRTGRPICANIPRVFQYFATQQNANCNGIVRLQNILLSISISIICGSNAPT